MIIIHYKYFIIPTFFVSCRFSIDEETQITCTFEPQVLQRLVKEASEKNEWKKLRFLYLGATGNKTSRGIAFECEASCVPLDLLIESNVEDLHNLVTLLLQRGALPDGLRGCRRPPLQASMEKMKFSLAVTLLRNNADPSCIVGHGIFISREVRMIVKSLGYDRCFRSLS